MDLVKELQNKKSADLKESQSQVVQDVKLLLAGEAQEDARIMRGLSANSNFVRMEQTVGKQITLENFDKKYGEVFHINQIKALCEKYHLRFLGTKHYTGNIDAVVVQKIREFANKHDHISTNNDYELRNSYFILAPPAMFELEDRVIVKQKDPVIFYQVDQEHYRMIHKWGNDFSFTRRFLGWKWKNAFNYLNYWTVIGAMAGSFLANVFTSTQFSVNNSWVTWVIAAQAGIAFRVIAYSTKLNGNDRLEKDYFTNSNWNKTFKLRQE